MESFFPPFQQLESKMPEWIAFHNNILSFLIKYPGINSPDIYFKKDGAL